MCSERLRPFLPELVPQLEKHACLEVDDETRALLVTASIAVERTFAPPRRRDTTRRMSQTKPGTPLRKQIRALVGGSGTAVTTQTADHDIGNIAS